MNGYSEVLFSNKKGQTTDINNMDDTTDTTRCAKEPPPPHTHTDTDILCDCMFIKYKERQS